MTFQEQILQGIPDTLPTPKSFEPEINHAPKRKDILTKEEKKLALQNALRYFDSKHHAALLPEFKNELETYGRVYMYRFRPEYRMYARPINEYPGKCQQAKAIMHMIQNNLDYAVAQHPHELVTYGGNGAVFQNWAQYALTSTQICFSSLFLLSLFSLFRLLKHYLVYLSLRGRVVR